MKTRYHVGRLLEEKNVRGDRSFLLTNRNGSYYYNNWNTQSGGWFVSEKDELFRVLAEIRIAAPKVSAIEHRLYAVEQRRNQLRETFFVPFNKKSLVYGVSVVRDIELVFDLRKALDSRRKGRFYNVVVEDGYTIIRFTKRSSKHEDDSNNEEEFTYFVVVNSPGKVLDKWEKRDYGNSPHAVCKLVRFRASRLVMTAGMDRVQALRENKEVCFNLNKLVAAQKKYAETFVKKSVGLSAAAFALDSLTQSLTDPVILSRLPGSSVLSRDESISLSALMLSGDYELAWKIMFRKLRALQVDGLLPYDYNSSGSLKTADSSGWLFFRLNNFLENNSFSKNKLKFAEQKLVKTIEQLRKRHSKNGLAWNKPSYTWMDIERSNAVVEIQALWLAMYQLAYRLTKNVVYRQYEEELRAKVRELFWNGENLADGLADFTARPNVFLAAYIYPQLLSKEEWCVCFRDVLEKLWSRESVCGTNGFWVNNVAAIAMYRIDKKMFKEYVDKIYFASKEELLWEGCVGMSSALDAATFVELCVELGR